MANKKSVRTINQKIIPTDREIIDFHIHSFKYKIERPEMLHLIIDDFNKRYPKGYFKSNN